MRIKTNYPDIPQQIWDCGIEPICVEHWGEDTLKQRINKVLPSGWRFLSHDICEKDSFGPVTSYLVLISPTDTYHGGLI